MAPHTITHCINDDSSFLRESRDIKQESRAVARKPRDAASVLFR